MGKFVPAVEAGLRGYKPHLLESLRTFLGDFDVTWESKRRLFGSNFHIFLLNPLPHMRALLGTDREIMLIYVDYQTVEARTFKAAQELFLDPEIAGRAEPLVYALLGVAFNLEDAVRTAMADASQMRIAVPFLEDVCKTEGRQDAYFVRKTFQRWMFNRDLFDVVQPVANDLFFFGRSAFVLELLDSLKHGENVGLFGLRKTGKTSILFKLRREIEHGNFGAIIYCDLQDASLNRLRWWQLLDELRFRVQGKFESYSSETEAAKLFRKSVEEYATAYPGKHLVIALDEIEHIAPDQASIVGWQQDFITFWKTVRAIQSSNRHFSVVVCGVNASVIETATYGVEDNPLFAMMKIRYVPAFTRDEVRHMVRTLGRVMGMQFEDSAFDELRRRYGGHPLLTRMACSRIHKRHADLSIRPIKITALEVGGEEARRLEQDLFPYAGQVLGMLRTWYPQEFGMLAQLAAENVEDYRIAAEQRPHAEHHLEAYGLAQGDPPHLAIPFLRTYIQTESRRTVKIRAGERDEAASGELSEEDLVKISRLRNRLEPKLRRFIRMVLIAQKGADRWIDVVLATIPEERRKRLQGVDARTILEQRVYLLDLIQIIDSNWEAFKHLEAADPKDQISRAQMKALLEFVNTHREDAHAKPVSAADLSTMQIVVPNLIRALDRYLE
jgi:hypothetical protein